MEYLVFGLIIFILVFLVIHYFSKQGQKKKIEQIRSAWSKPKTESFHFNNIRRYADKVKDHEFHRLTDQTLGDIDFYDLFAFIDRTTSKIGQQFLFKKIIEPTNNSSNQSQALVDLFTNDKKIREEIQLELIKLNHSDVYHISSLLQDQLLPRPKWLKFLIIDIVLVLGMFLLSIKFPALLIVLTIPVAINTLIHYWNKTNTFQFIRSIPQLNLLINISKTISKKGELFSSESVKESIADLGPFQKKAGLITFDNTNGVQGELSLIANYLFKIIKAFLLIEVFIFFKMIKELETKQHAVLTLFNYVGNIDASISIASLRAGTLTTCLPVLTPVKKELTTKGMYHPLIDNCVANDLSISEKSVLITGSNMSGKSTFLRTLTINSILAQTIYTCFAKEFVSPILKQYSSIRIDDNLFQGRSYYFQEVNIMGSLLTAAKSPCQNLFVLDEVFKGTNTVERIAAAKGILSYLNRNDNIVVVSTHDIELSDMLADEYDLYHFTETIEDNELDFDFKIKEGQVRTRNAIKLLELSNYPVEVIREAREICTNLRRARI